MYKSLEEIVKVAEEEEKSFFEVILEDDCKERAISKEESIHQMREMYVAMKQADASYDAKLVSASGLVGCDGDKMRVAREKQDLVCGDFIGLVMEKALKMGESNACMKRIVAAPTAGSCGVLPAVLLSLEEKEHYTEEISLQEIARLVSLNPDYFTRFFKKYMGMTFLDYVNSVRMEHVVRDLQRTDLSVQKLLEIHGFTNYKLFMKMYKSRFESTPGKMRRYRKEQTIED